MATLTATGQVLIEAEDGSLRPMVSSDAPRGRSAYEEAVEQGFSGTVNDWLASLKGANGTNGADGANGAPGASAYQEAQGAGYGGTKAQWLASLKGADGANGTNGTNGADGANGAKGDPGTPAYVPPKNVILDTAPAHAVGAGADTVTSGKLRLYRAHVPMVAGMTIAFLSAVSASALNTGANQWFCLVNLATMKVVAVTVDDGATAWAANARKTLAIAGGPYTAGFTGPVALGIMQAATTPAQVRSSSSTANFLSRFPDVDAIVFDHNAAGLTAPLAVGANIVPAAAGGGVGYLWAA